MSIERMGIQKGKSEGIPQGKRELLVRLIQKRFGAGSADTAERILGGVEDPHRLDEVGEWIVECATAEELMERLVTLPRSGAVGGGGRDPAPDDRGNGSYRPGGRRGLRGGAGPSYRLQKYPPEG